MASKRRSTTSNFGQEATSAANPGTSPLNSPVPDESDLPREDIAMLAYSYWENRQGQGGSAEEDWLRAEQELRSKTMRVRTAGSGGGA